MKRGISLIAVLMFMLAATTASIVIFRMLSSENFSSGARLKASEAYKASESGIDAVHSWLANRGVEAAELVTQYMNQSTRYPLKINYGDPNVFEAYVIGADASGGNGKPVRLKILVEGKGRDKSVVSQTAILKVSGLYRTSINPIGDIPESDPDDVDDPPPQDNCTPTPNPEPPVCQADPIKPPSTGKCALPDLWGNMATVGRIDARTMIITQTTDECNGGGQGLNSIKIGKPDSAGYLILDGNFYANNGINIYGDLYANGAFFMCASGSDWIKKDRNGKGGNLYAKEFHPMVSFGTLLIEGSAYFADSVNPNVLPKRVCNPAGGNAQLGCLGALGGAVNIKGNTTIRGPYFAYTGNIFYQNDWQNWGGNLNFNMEGNLVMDNVSHMSLNYEDKDNTSSSKFEVKQNAYVKQFTTNQSQNKNNDSKSGLWPTFNNLCLGVDYDGTKPNYSQKGSNPKFNFKANGTIGKCNANASWGADELKNLKEELELSGNMTQSCQRPPVKFDMKIYNEAKKTTPAKWVHRDNQPGGCASGSGQMNLSKEWSPLLTELNTCWKSKKSDEIYKNDPSDKNEWIVIYIKDNYNFQRVNGNLGDGKYIIIFDFEKKIPFDPANPYGIQYLYLPPTGKNAIVMLYFPKGFNGRIELDGNESGKIAQQSEYNYFIFSDADIREFNTTADRFLHGNVFMNNCAKINLPSSATNPYFYSRGNDAFVDQLMESNILSATEHCRNFTSDNNNTNITYTLECTSPPEKGFVGEAIKPPTVTCKGSNGISKTCGFDWVNAPSWSCPQEGTYNVGVKANANSGNCQNSSPVQCGKNITLTISKPQNTTLTCKGLPKKGKVGEEIRKPKVRCGGQTIESGFSFMGMEEPNWKNPVEGSYTVSVKATSGTCSPKIEECGTLTVTKDEPIDNKNEPWIPISSRLAVKLESKEISKQRIDDRGHDDNKLAKSILVMPRVVRILESDPVISRKYIRNRYSYMYMNGAKNADTAAAEQLECVSTANGKNLFTEELQKDVYVCSFRTPKVKHSSFYVAIGADACKDCGSSGVAECILTPTKDNKNIYTHGRNISPSIKCNDKSTPTNTVFEAVFGPPLTKDLSGNYYYSGPEAYDNAIISASGKCGSKDFEGLCYSLVNSERDYTIEVNRPTCTMERGPHESKCPQANPYDCKVETACGGTAEKCCCTNISPVYAPTHDCGTATKDGPPRYPKFNYSPENDIGLTGNIDNIKWNEDPPKPHNFNTIGLNRVTRMYQVWCGGHELNYGTKNGKDGVNCGSFDVIKEGTSGNYKPNLAACESKVSSCSINACQKRGVGIPPPTFTCKDGSPNYVKFRYSDVSKPGQLSTTIPEKWNNGEYQSFTSDGKRDVFIQEIKCGDELLKCSSGSVTDLGLPCGFVDIKNDCASSVTATCKLVTKSGTEVSDLAVTQGENIKAPKITCSDGSTPSWPTFGSTGSGLPSGAASNWPDNGNAYYTAAHDTGSYTISVSSVNCGATTVSNITCGTINVQRPICSISGTYTYVNSSTPNVPAPTYSCGNATKTTGTNVNEFKYTDANGATVSGTATTNWNNNPPSNMMITARANADVYMYKVTCDDNTLTYGTSNTSKDGIKCAGSFSVVSSSTSGSGSSSASGGGTNITLSTSETTLNYGTTYTVTCSDTNKDIVCKNACSNMQVCYKYNGGSENCVNGNSTIFSIINGKLNDQFNQKCANNATIQIMSTPACSITCKNNNTYY